MKKLFQTSLMILVFFCLLIVSNCKKSEDTGNDDDNPTTVELLQEITSLQEAGAQNLLQYLQSNDTATSKVMLIQFFESNENVEWADTNSQGIIVQYKEGFRGGIFISGEDSESGEGITPTMPEKANLSKSDNLFKTNPNIDAMVFLNPHYTERTGWYNWLMQKYDVMVPRVFNYFVALKDNMCTVEAFTHLDEYGYIHIYSHGFAWPRKRAIAEVYLMTGEVVSAEGLTNYANQLKSEEIIILYDLVRRKNYFYISPIFIKNNNDFSQDTIVFYGGFCFSFQGGWPNLLNEFSGGIYVGHTWGVYTDKNCKWANSLFDHLSDTTKFNPITIEQWMTLTPEIPKEYYYEPDNVTVKLHYSGDATMSLWKREKTTATIVSLETDGSPLLVPGTTDYEYHFKCNVEGEFSDINWLKFRWDFGDGSPVQEIEADNTITHSWTSAGQFPLKVELIYLGTTQPFAEKTVSVTIDPSTSYIENYASQKTVSDNHFNLDVATIITTPSKIFNLRNDTLINVMYPPNFNYKHQIDLWDKHEYQPGEVRTYTITFTLSNLTTDYTGTPSFKRLSVQYWDKNGSTYAEYDGLSPISINVQTDETHQASFTVDAWIWVNSGLGSGETHLYPLDMSIVKDY